MYVDGVAAPRSFPVINHFNISNSRHLSGISCDLGRPCCFGPCSTGIVQAYVSSDLSEAFNMTMEPSKQAISQYSKTSDELALRVAILSHDIQKQTWYSWLEERLGVAGDVLEVGCVYFTGFSLSCRN